MILLRPKFDKDLILIPCNDNILNNPFGVIINISVLMLPKNNWSIAIIKIRFAISGGRDFHNGLFDLNVVGVILEIALSK